MIKIISNALRVRHRLLPARMMAFCATTTGKTEKSDKIAKKTQDINTMFTDKAIEESKEQKITNGKNSLK